MAQGVSIYCLFLAIPQVAIDGEFGFLLDDPEGEVTAAFVCAVFALPPVPPANISWFLVDASGNMSRLNGAISRVDYPLSASNITVTLGAADRRLICRATNVIGSGENSVNLEINGEAFKE